MTPRDDGTSVSGSLLARRYFSSADSYATLVVGAGTAPTEAPLGGGLGVRWSTGYEHEALRETADRDRISFSLGLDTRL